MASGHGHLPADAADAVAADAVAADAATVAAGPCNSVTTDATLTPQISL